MVLVCWCGVMWAGSVNTCYRSVGSMCCSCLELQLHICMALRTVVMDGTWLMVQKKMRAVHEAVLVWQSRTVDERRIRRDTSCHMSRVPSWWQSVM